MTAALTTAFHPSLSYFALYKDFRTFTEFVKFFTKMTIILDYSRLYDLCEELSKLRGSQLQAVHGLSETRFALDFRLPGQSRWLIVDLTPARPFIVSTHSTKFKGKKKVTPVANFLNAHFVGARLASLEVAQKPNRTVKMIFTSVAGGEETKTLIFKCFPHGQHLLLHAGEKFVQLPIRPKPENEEEIAFVEPEAAPEWNLNDALAGEFLETAEKKEGGGRGLVPYHAKLVKKLEKAIEALEAGAGKSQAGDQAKIDELSRQAEKMKSAAGAEKIDSAALQAVYDEIKRIKRKTLQLATRRNDLVRQLEDLRNQPALEEPAAVQAEAPKTKKGEDGFSGTRVRLDGKFELWVGRSDWQNDDLVRLASPHELWIHLRDYPGAHGVIRAPKKSEPSHAQIEFSCRVVALLSRSKKKPFAEGEWLDFIVTPKKFVKKPKGAAAGRVIVERENVRRVAYKTVKFEPI